MGRVVNLTHFFLSEVNYMILKIILAFLCVVALCCIVVFIYKNKKILQEDNELKEKNLQIRKENELLHSIILYVTKLLLKLKLNKCIYTNNIAAFNQMRNEINHQRIDAEHTTQASFSTYCDMLDTLYSEKEKRI